jgi:hypothetical protein
MAIAAVRPDLAAAAAKQGGLLRVRHPWIKS